jgi:hypothetical protein
MSRPLVFALKSSLALLLAVLALAIAGVVWSSRERAAARAELGARTAALQAARAAESQGRSDARLVAQHLQGYRALVAGGFVGEENRLAWIEAAQLANRDAHLYGLTYTLSPRGAAPPELAGGLPLQQTRMKLRMPLLVEADLPRFLDALRARAPGIFRVEACSLRRPADAPPQLANTPALEADCDLLWFTVASAAGGKA